MGILKEKMSGKWERGEVQEDEEEGQVGGWEKLEKGLFLFSFFGIFQKLPILKEIFLSFSGLGSVFFLPARL